MWWNPWHGCVKISPACKHCYVYRQDVAHGSEVGSEEVRKNSSFDLPLKRKRDKSYKITSGTLVFTCFTSDFWVNAADNWRADAWSMMRGRPDLTFMIFTKRIDRFCVSLPEDWGESGNEARVCDYKWVLSLREQCIEKNVPFCFHQTGARFLKDGKTYRIKRKISDFASKKSRN